jgi:hypothetical protein
MKSNLFAELFPALFLLGCADVEDSTIPPERVSEVRLGSDGGGEESTPPGEKPLPKDLGCGKTCYNVPGQEKRFCVDNPCDPYAEIFDPSIPRVQPAEQH